MFLCIVVFRKEFGEKIENGFLVIILSAGILFIAIQPPKCSTWDEHIHFIRTFQWLEQGEVDIKSLFVGNCTGTIGETSAIALLIGAAFLLYMKVIDLRIPLTYIGSFLLYIVIFGGHGYDSFELHC